MPRNSTRSPFDYLSDAEQNAIRWHVTETTGLTTKDDGYNAACEGCVPLEKRRQIERDYREHLQSRGQALDMFGHPFR